MESASGATASFVVEILTAASFEDSSQAEFRLVDDAVLVVLRDGTSRLIHLSGDVLALNHESTRLITASLAEGAEHVAAETAVDCDADLAQVRSDLQEFLADLVRRGAIRDRNQTARVTAAGRLAHWLLPPVLAVLRCRGMPSERRLRTLLWTARLSFAIFGWTRTVAIWQAASVPRHQMGNRSPVIAEVGKRLREVAAGHWGSPECKERALCCWTILRWLGEPAELVLAIDFFPFFGHCWCEASGAVVDDDVRRCQRFVPILRYR